MIEQSASILIAGSGFVGSRLVRFLDDAGIHVYPLRRSPQSARPDSRTHPIQADLLDAAALLDLPQTVNCVIFTASADESTPASYRKTYLDAQKNLASALEKMGRPINRWLFVSSTRVFGDTGGDWVDESSPARPSDELGEILLQAEHLAHNMPWPSSVIRFSGIYGPGRNRLLKQCMQQQIALPPEGLYSNRIHRDDCARVLLHLLQSTVVHPLVLASDRDPVEYRAFIQWVYHQLRLSPPNHPGHPAGRKQRSNKRCNANLLVRSGFHFQYPSYREGYPPLIRDILDEAGQSA
jgi:nucleoside-diphosphate-sugar epimerase